jgi:hypothetical protein
MRIKCDSYPAAEALAKNFEECHIERAHRSDKCWLVVDSVGKRLRA